MSCERKGQRGWEGDNCDGKAQKEMQVRIYKVVSQICLDEGGVGLLFRQKRLKTESMSARSLSCLAPRRGQALSNDGRSGRCGGGGSDRQQQARTKWMEN